MVALSVIVVFIRETLTLRAVAIPVLMESCNAVTADGLLWRLFRAEAVGEIVMVRTTVVPDEPVAALKKQKQKR